MIQSLGLQKTTLLDYPGKVAATIFTHGCPLRCPYCHNPDLISGPVPDYFISLDEFDVFLKRRSRVLEGVCVTGGEPLLHHDIESVVDVIRSHDLLVKLDTSGIFPDRLRDLLAAGVLDYVAMDVKTAFSAYDKVRGDGEAILESLRIIRQSGVDHEFRTTMAPGIVGEEELFALVDHIGPDDDWYLTQFRPSVTLDPTFTSRDPYFDQTLLEWCRALRQKKRRCMLRGVQQVVEKGLEPLTERI